MKVTHTKYIITIRGTVPDFNLIYTTKNKAEEALQGFREEAEQEYNDLLKCDTTDPHIISELNQAEYRMLELDIASVKEIYITYEIKY